MAFAPLFELNDQFQAKNGHNLTGGFLRVYLAYTDDLAETYSDYIGTRNPRDIVIDDNGRAVVICDSDKAYRLEVYDSEGMLLWTEEPVFCTGTGGGGGGTGTSTRIESTDQSISVESATVGSVTTYDLAIAPDTKDMLEWAETGDTVVSDGDVFPEVNEGTMESEHDMGIFLQGNQVYHVTNSFTVYPTGNGINYDTLNVKLMLDSTELCSRSYDIDNSVSDPVECEFSYDVATSADGYLHWTISGASAFSSTTAKMQIHRVYSGLAAVPSTYATKAYVDSGLSGKISYSALEYNTASKITGISGSAIATTNVDPTEYIPWSASGVFQPSGDYVSTTDFSACCSAMSGAVSSLQVDVTYISSIVSSISGQTGDFVEKSSISAESSVWNTVTGKQPSGDYLSATESSNYILTSQSGMFQPSGDYAYNSSVSSKVEQSAFDQCCSAMSAKVSALETGKLDNSASSTWYPMTGNPSGFLTEHQELTGYVEKSSISAESANWNEVSAKQDSSAMSAYVPFSAIESNTASAITSIGGSSIKGHEYTGVSPIVVDNVNDEISVQHSSLTVDSSMTAYESAGCIVLGVNQSALDLSSYQLTADMSAYIPVSALSGDGTSITSISGSSLGGTGDYVAKSSLDVAIGSGNSVGVYGLAQGSANTAMGHSLAQGVKNYADLESLAQGLNNSANATSLAQGSGSTAVNNSLAQGRNNSALYVSLAQGFSNSANSTSLAQGYQNSASNTSVAIGSGNSASAASFAQGVGNRATQYSFAQGPNNSADIISFAQGLGLSSKNTAAAFGKYNLLGNGASTGDNVAFVIGDGAGSASRHDLLNVFKDGRIVTYSSTADTTGYDFKSAISSKLDTSAFSSVSGTFLTAVPAGYATESYVDSAVSGKLDATASSQFITSLPADLATTADVASAVSAKLDTSASSSFYPMTSNPSGYLTAHQSLAGYATEQYVDSSVSGKLDSTAYDSAQFYLTSNPSGFATTAYVDSAVSGVEITFDSSITTASSTAGITASVNTAIFSGKLDETAFSTVSGTFLTSVDLTPYQLTADMSGYLQTSESSNYYPASNPSGFVTGIDLSNYATTAYVDSAVSGKLDASAEVVTSIGVAAGALSSINGYGLSAGTANSAGTALYDSAGRALTSMATKAEVSGAAMAYAASAISSVSGNYYPTSNPSGFISGVDLTDYATTAYVDSAVSGVEISFDSSISTASSTAGVTASVNTAILAPYQLTADMSGYLQTSESSNYYSTSNPSGFITGVDLSPYQTTAGMTAYQPSGEYIYASALGTGVI